MNQKDLSEKKALEAAIALEEKGHQFFRDAALKAKSILTGEIFDYLSSEELNHLKAINNFSENFLNGLTVNTDSLIQEIKERRSPIDQFFDRLAKNAPLDGGELDAYHFAADFERRSELFYAKAEAEATDPAAKKLFGFLIGEERKHFKIMESCLSYFENPAEFFHQREKWHLEA